MTKVDFPYLDKQFAEIDVIVDGIKSVVARGDFTLGKEVDELERLLEHKLGVRHAIGVNCGTDALKLALKAVGVEPGDEVITSANTFIATIGAINEIGATPVFVDCNNIFCTDASKVEAAITERTKAIVPVHLSGAVSDMDAIMRIATKRGLHVVEDACQAFMSELNGRKAGTIGHAGAYSLHPMKFLNIWGDGGIVVTNDDALAARLRLLRNHGLESRDSVVILGYNSRLDTIQAVVAKHVLATSSRIIDARVMNAGLYDRAFRSINQLTVPPRDPAILHTYVTYQVLAENRDQLLNHCRAAGVDCRVHYPLPIYRHKAMEQFGHKKGDFPIADYQADHCITFPVHQYVAASEIEYAIDVVGDFYRRSPGGAS